jgi:CubicO group peptidase (beta-lactamase class C family)
MDATKLAEAQAYAEGSGKLGSGLIIRRGYKVHEWGSQTFRYQVASVTKGIGALLLGIAVDDGLVAVSDTAFQHFSGIGIPPQTNGEGERGVWRQELTLEQLATHSSGFEVFRHSPVLDAEPGTVWTYSDGGANWLADTLTTKFNRDLREVLADRILSQLGITVRRTGSEAGDLTWRDRTPDSQLNGVPRREFNAGIGINVDSMARIGLLVERDGDWNGTRILSQAYLEQMARTSPIIEGLPIRDSGGQDHSADFPNVTQHHGLLWFNNSDETLQDVPADTFWTWGAGDHLIVVIPSLELVIARTSGQALDGAPSVPWERQCQTGTWCARYEVLAPFLTPIAQAVQDEGVPPPPPGAPTVSLTSSTSSVAAGGTVTLNWSSASADACTASNGWSGAKATTGSETVTVSQTTTYTLGCTGAGGTTTQSVTVTVGAAPNPNPPPTGGGGGGGGGVLEWWLLGTLLMAGGLRRARRTAPRLMPSLA